MIRVDRSTFDPIAVGTVASGVEITIDPLRNPPYVKDARFDTRNDRPTSEALNQMAIPADVIRTLRRPGVGPIFPTTTGYSHEALTIDDVLNTDRWAPRRRSWTSGAGRAPERLETVEDRWDGSLRGVIGTTNI